MIEIAVTYSFVVGTWQFVGGLGDDVISVRTSACNSNVSVVGDAGVDTLVVDTNYFVANVLMDGGADADRLELRNSLGIVTATLDAGAGADAVFVSNLTASRLSLILGAQNDTADVRGSLLDEIFAHLGDHDDSLTLYGNLVRRASAPTAVRAATHSLNSTTRSNAASAAWALRHNLILSVPLLRLGTSAAADPRGSAAAPPPCSVSR